MKYSEFVPSERLRPYVKCFYLFQSDSGMEVKDTVFPGGNMEIIFNLGDGIWEIAPKTDYQKTPPIELWGQVTKPLLVKSRGRQEMLGIRFYTHGATFFFKEDLWEFNDLVLDARDVLDCSVSQLYSLLLEIISTQDRIQLIERFLLDRLFSIRKKADRIKMIGLVTWELQNETLSQNIPSIASNYNVTARHLQNLFLQHTGITPKLYQKIARFQRSLKLIAKKEIPLTSIAYHCGYFDQSHFIKDFKSFTGVTPTDYTTESFPVAMALTNN